MPSNHLILCHLIFLPPSIIPSIKVFFKWVSSLHEVAKVLEFQLQHQLFQWIFRTDFLWDGLVWSPWSPRDSQESSRTPQFKSINSSVLNFLYSPILKSRDITLPTKVHLVKAMVFLAVMYGCESWTIKTENKHGYPRGREGLAVKNTVMDTVMDWTGSPLNSAECWNHNLLWDDIWRWGLWELTQVRWGYKGGALVVDSVGLC